MDGVEALCVEWLETAPALAVFGQGSTSADALISTSTRVTSRIILALSFLAGELAATARSIRILEALICLVRVPVAILADLLIVTPDTGWPDAFVGVGTLTSVTISSKWIQVVCVLVQES